MHPITAKSKNEETHFCFANKSLHFLSFLVAEIIASGKHLIYSDKVTKETGEIKKTTRKARNKYYAVIIYFIAKNENPILQN